MKKFLAIFVALLAIPAMTAFAAQKTVGLVVSTLNNPFFVTLKDGAVGEAKKAGINLIVLDSQNDPAKEIANVEDLLSKGVAAILVFILHASELISFSWPWPICCCTWVWTASSWRARRLMSAGLLRRFGRVLGRPARALHQFSACPGRSPDHPRALLHSDGLRFAPWAAPGSPCRSRSGPPGRIA